MNKENSLNQIKAKKERLEGTNIPIIKQYYKQEREIFSDTKNIRIKDMVSNFSKIGNMRVNLKALKDTIIDFRQLLEKDIIYTNSKINDLKSKKEFTFQDTTNIEKLLKEQERLLKISDVIEEIQHIINPLYEESTDRSNEDISIKNVLDLAETYDLMKELKYSILDYCSTNVMSMEKEVRYYGVDNCITYYKKMMYLINRILGLNNVRDKISNTSKDTSFHEYIKSFSDLINVNPNGMKLDVF